MTRTLCWPLITLDDWVNTTLDQFVSIRVAGCYNTDLCSVAQVYAASCDAIGQVFQAGAVNEVYVVACEAIGETFQASTLTAQQISCELESESMIIGE